MSGVLDCLSLKWKIHVPRHGVRIESQSFPFRYGILEMDCVENHGDISLRLYKAGGSTLRDSFYTVSVQVESVKTKRIVPELTETMYDWTPDKSVTWIRNIREVEKANPGFRLNRWLTFLVSFADKDDQIVNHNYNPTSDASVQTDPSLDPTACLIKLSEDLSKLLDADSNPDVELHCEGQIIKSHKIILRVRSPVLDTLLAEDVKKIELQDMDFETLQQFNKYLLTGNLDALTVDTAMRLYRAGNKYDVKCLTIRCRLFLVENLSIGKAFDVLVVAEEQKDSSFVESVTSYILDNEIPQKNSVNWLVFCETNPALAIKVANRIIRC